MKNLINIEKLSMNKSKVVGTLTTLLIGIAPKTYLRGVKTQAEARATKEHVKASSDVEVRKILVDAEEEMQLREQARLASIIYQAAPQIEPDADPNKIDPDWIENFRAKGRHVTTEDMQALWAHLLATETNSPGSFSKRTVNIAAEMDRRDAVIFSDACRFLCTIDSVSIILVFDIKNKIYWSNGLTFDHLQHVESMGLITLGDTGQHFPEACNIVVKYFGETRVIKREKGRTMPLGSVSLTLAGRQLATIVESEPVSGFLDYCRIPLVSWVTLRP